DNNQGRTTGQIVADTEALADDLRNNFGYKKICVVNQPPNTSGTFTTEAGQTATGFAAGIAAINAGLLASSHFDSQIDAHALMCGVDTTKWKANYSGDGIHPNATGYADLTTALLTILTSWGF